MIEPNSFKTTGETLADANPSSFKEPKRLGRLLQRRKNLNLVKQNLD